MICCYDPFCRLWLAYIYLLVIFCTTAVIYILSSLVVQRHFMDESYTHVQLHLMTTFLCLRILKCSPPQSTLRTLERSSPHLLCRRSSTKQASFIVHIQNHEVPGIFVHLICELCLEPMRYNWSCEIYTCENNLVKNS